MCMTSVLPACIYVHMYVWYHREQKRAMDFLELELQMFMRYMCWELNLGLF